MKTRFVVAAFSLALVCADAQSQIAYRLGMTDQEIGAIYYQEILKTIELSPAKRDTAEKLILLHLTNSRLLPKGDPDGKAKIVALRKLLRDNLLTLVDSDAEKALLKENARIAMSLPKENDPPA